MPLSISSWWGEVAEVFGKPKVVGLLWWPHTHDGGAGAGIEEGGRFGGEEEEEEEEEEGRTKKALAQGPQEFMHAW